MYVCPWHFLLTATRTNHSRVISFGPCRKRGIVTKTRRGKDTIAFIRDIQKFLPIKSEPGVITGRIKWRFGSGNTFFPEINQTKNYHFKCQIDSRTSTKRGTIRVRASQQDQRWQRPVTLRGQVSNSNEEKKTSIISATISYLLCNSNLCGVIKSDKKLCIQRIKDMLGESRPIRTYVETNWIKEKLFFLNQYL